MKKLFFSAIAVAAFSVGFAQKKSDDVAKFQTETIDLGKIEQGIPSTATFIVTNVGSTPLIIEQANPTCGCTIGNYTKEPIAPGQTGTITATYNAAAVSTFEKHMTVKFAGADDMKSITIKGEVLSKEDYAKLKNGNSPSMAEVKPNANASDKAKATVATTPATKVKTKTKHAGAKKVTKIKSSPVAKQ